MLKRNIFFRTFILIISSILLAACGGGATDSAGGSGGTTPATTINTTTVDALNPNASNWNDYVNANGDPCDVTTDTTCTNGGLLRVIYVENTTSCNGVSAVDNLDAFNWVCDTTTGQARVATTGFKPGKGISDLIDFTSASWRKNSIIITNNGSTYTSTADYWWNNPINVLNTGAGQMNPGEIYIVIKDTNADYVLGNRVTLLIGSTTTTAILSGVVSTSSGTSFVWIEGKIDTGGVKLSGTDFSTLNNLTVTNVTGVASGIALQSSSYNTLRNITATNNGIGVYLHSSPENTLTDITASTNTSDGIYLDNFSSNNALINIIASDNGTNGTGAGIHLSSSENITFTGSLVASNNGGLDCNISSNSSTIPGLDTSCQQL